MQYMYMLYNIMKISSDSYNATCIDTVFDGFHVKYSYSLRTTNTSENTRAHVQIICLHTFLWVLWSWGHVCQSFLTSVHHSKPSIRSKRDVHIWACFDYVPCTLLLSSGWHLLTVDDYFVEVPQPSANYLNRNISYMYIILIKSGIYILHCAVSQALPFFHSLCNIYI